MLKFCAVFAIFLIGIFIANATLCPDGAYKCPIWGTCCENRDGSYGCCPYREADCCSDFIHCCPIGSHCNITTSRCDNDPKIVSSSFEWMVPHYSPDIIGSAFESPKEINEQPIDYDQLIIFNEQPIDYDQIMMFNELVISDHACPDGHRCEDVTTCCQTENSTYGCCPFQNADCCDDKVHCCPGGSKCDTKNRRCEKEIYVLNIADPEVPKMFNLKANSFEMQGVKDNVCPDGADCDDDATCCQMKDGKYGCCPYRDADCCQDKEHCCPSGFNCDVKNNRCIKGLTDNFQNEALKELPIFNLKKNKFENKEPLRDISCNRCRLTGEKCCKDEASKFCCPHDAVCSMDGIRCVKPKENELDTFLYFNDFIEKKPEEQNPELEYTGSVVCPDKTEFCPAESTCCLTASGNYGCCPLSSATCCPDKQNCCPTGFVCSDHNCERTTAFRLFEKPIFQNQVPLK